MLKFKNCQVTVSGKPIMAENVSISEETSLQPVYSVGFKGPITNTPSRSVINNISIDYVMETNQEPNYHIAKNIREYSLNVFPVEIIIGGITGNGYLSSYSISIQPNNVVKASVQYDIFSELRGNLLDQKTGVVTGYNLLNGSGAAHYWTTYAKTIDGSLTGSILQGNYSFNVNWIPIYAIGKNGPQDVKFINAIENFSLISEYADLRVKTSGKNFESIFNNVEMIEFNNLSSMWSTQNNNTLKLYPASGKIISNKINFVENSPILNETNVIKYY